jgi:taurine transport system ATP-binding protein
MGSFTAGNPNSAETGVSSARRESVISLRALSVRYDSDLGESMSVLNDIDLDIHEGEFVCLLGPSGCGKSTLLKVVAGLIEPTSGQAMLDGKAISGPDWQRGVVFQQPPLYPWLTVERNVSFGPRMRGIPGDRIAEETKQYLEKVHLGASAKKKIYELSGGMRQRVAIARSLINNPRILLMDEPFGALDALTREQMQVLVRSLWADTRKTILFITHDVDEALSLGTRVLLMSKGSGRIEKDIEVDFTWRIAEDTDSSVYISKEFQSAREEIVSTILGRSFGYGL